MSRTLAPCGMPVKRTSLRAATPAAPDCSPRPTHVRRSLVVAIIASLTIHSLTPVAASAQTRGDAAFLFAYRAKPDMDAAFAQGYRRHLDWHAQRNDSLPWLAWTVIDGPGLGTFVDGTFGIPFKAFDDRVDQRGDADDAARNVNAYATAVYRQVHRLRRDLGSSARLETRRPGAMQKVVRVAVPPGSERAFEDAVKSIALRKDGHRQLDFSVYEQLSGGDAPAYVIIVQLAAWAELEDADADVTRAIFRAAGSAITRAEAEVWLYRPDLTYFPKR